MAQRKKGTQADTPFGRITAFIERQTDTLVTLQRELVKLIAIAPCFGGAGEGQKADFLEQWFASNGFPATKRLAALQDGIPRPNLLLKIGGRDRSRTLWFVSHLDVNPPGEISLWKSDPFVLRVEGDKLVGCGVEDNHQGIVASTMAAMALLQQGIEPACDIGLLFVADGTGSSIWGLRYLMEQHRDQFGRDDAFIVTDNGNEDGSLIVVAEKAILWLKIKVVGKQVHSSTPHLGKNALVSSSHMIVKLRSLYDKLDMRNPIYDPPMSTFEPTRGEINASDIGFIPGEDVFYLDCRVIPEISVEDVLGQIRLITEEISRVNRVVVNIEVVRREDGSSTEPENPVVVQLTKAIKRVYGVDARPKGIGRETLASYIRKAGFTAIAWSKMDDTARRPNEYVWIQNIIGDSKVFAAMMMGDHLEPLGGSNGT